MNIYSSSALLNVFFSNGGGVVITWFNGRTRSTELEVFILKIISFRLEVNFWFIKSSYRGISHLF